MRETFRKKFGRPEVEALLGYTDHAHLHPLSQLEVKLLVTDPRVLFVQLQKFAFLEE